MTTVPNTNAGIPAFETEDFTITNLLSGPAPRFATPEVVEAGTVLVAGSVVGRDANNYIVLATTGNTDPADDITPIGVLAHDVADVSADQACTVLRDGQFNPDKLTWDASFSTEALKVAAFEGSTGPTKVVIRAPATADA